MIKTLFHVIIKAGNISTKSPKKHEPKGLEKHWKRIVSRKNMGKGLPMEKTRSTGLSQNNMVQKVVFEKTRKGLSLEKTREKGCLKKKFRKVVSPKTRYKCLSLETTRFIGLYQEKKDPKDCLWKQVPKGFQWKKQGSKGCL